MEAGIALPQFAPCGRRIVHRPDVEDVSVVKQEIAELGLADVRCVRQHRLEHRLQLAGRRTDDAQHFGCRRLLLQRFSEIVSALTSSLSSRVFSMAMTAWAAKFCTSSICLSVKGRTSWRIDAA